MFEINRGCAKKEKKRKERDVMCRAEDDTPYVKWLMRVIE